MDIEAYAVVAELLGQAHEHGEAIASKAELWIGVSSGLIVMAYFAPERMKIAISALVIVLYVALSIFIFTNMSEDLAMSRMAVEDARILAEAEGIESQLLSHRISDAGGSGETGAGFVLFVGLFFGTIGFLVATAYHTWRKGRGAGT